MTRTARLLGEIALLAVLTAIYQIDGNLFLGLATVAVLATPPLNWFVALILIRSSRRAPDIRSLEERADDAVTLALISTAWAVVTLTTVLHVGENLIMPVVVFAVLLVTVPAVEWLGTWRRVWLPQIERQEHE